MNEATLRDIKKALSIIIDSQVQILARLPDTPKIHLNELNLVSEQLRSDGKDDKRKKPWSEERKAQHSNKMALKWAAKKTTDESWYVYKYSDLPPQRCEDQKHIAKVLGVTVGVVRDKLSVNAHGFMIFLPKLGLWCAVVRSNNSDTLQSVLDSAATDPELETYPQLSKFKGGRF